MNRAALPALTFLCLLAAASSQAAPQFAKPTASPPGAPAGSESPVCAEASHDRLLVQPARDVCAAALSSTGAPRVPGFLPTRCRLQQSTLRLDAIGARDLCLSPSVQ